MLYSTAASANFVVWRMYDGELRQKMLWVCISGHRFNSKYWSARERLGQLAGWRACLELRARGSDAPA